MVRAVITVFELTIRIVIRPHDRIFDAVAHGGFVKRTAVDIFFAEEYAYGRFIGAGSIDARIDVIAESASRVQVHDQKAYVFVVGFKEGKVFSDGAILIF